MRHTNTYDIRYTIINTQYIVPAQKVSETFLHLTQLRFLFSSALSGGSVKCRIRALAYRIFKISRVKVVLRLQVKIL